MNDRRTFLKLLAAAVATTASTGCSAGTQQTDPRLPNGPRPPGYGNRPSSRCCRATGPTPSGSPSPARRGSRPLRCGTVTPQGRSGRDPRGRTENRSPHSLGDERGPLALAGVEQRSRGRQQVVQGMETSLRNARAVGRRRRAARSGRRRRQDVIPGRLDAIAESDTRAAAADGARPQGGHRGRRSVEQVPVEPDRVRPLRRRIRVSLGQAPTSTSATSSSTASLRTGSARSARASSSCT